MPDWDGFLDKCTVFIVIAEVFVVRTWTGFLHIHILSRTLVFVTFIEFMKDILHDLKNNFVDSSSSSFLLRIACRC